VTKLAEPQTTIRLGDFGLATDKRGWLHDVVGSEFYYAPEMFSPKGSVTASQL